MPMCKKLPIYKLIIMNVDGSYRIANKILLIIAHGVLNESETFIYFIIKN